MGSVFLEEKPFSAYGHSHWAVLVLFALAAVLLVRLGKAQRVTRRSRQFSRALAVTLLAFQVPFQLYSMLPPHWEVGESLPFQLCDLAWMVAAVALWSHRQWAFSLHYYWGLTLTSQAFLTPQLEFDFPHLQFIMFWGVHGLVVLGAIYLTWGLGLRPDWRGYLLALGATVGWGFVMLWFNSLAGTNYLYVNRKPPGGSVLDLLGDWPWYLLFEVAVIVVLWALITLPWRGRPERR